MSGGSWDYVYRHFDEVSDRLRQSADPQRVALGLHVADVAKAMHAIEWNDSDDGTASGPTEGQLIEKVLRPQDEMFLAAVQERILQVAAVLDEALRTLRREQRGTDET